MERPIRTLCTLSLLAGLALTTTAGWAVTQDQLGRTEKYRVLVDKVLMASNKWVMTEEHVKEIAAAGFNVVSPRLGNEDPAEVRKIAQLAAKYGMCHMPWMRGSNKAKGSVRMIWADGSEQDLCSPNSDELWDWMTAQIVTYAKLSTECPALMGVFLDYENYSDNSGGNCYDLSYDEQIMGAFARAQGLKLPALAPKERAPWLKQQGLSQAFSAFQIAHWRARCRALRQAVDAINPKFQFCVYPAPGTLIMVEAIYREWGTAAAPLILADPSIYGRPGGLVPHAQAIELNREILLKNQAFARARSPHMLYMGGLDPVVKGADPEFSGRNAAMSATVTDGYWIFYEGPVYETTHPEYFRWFSRANRAIARGDTRFADRPRKTPDLGDPKTVVRKTDKPQLAVYDSRVGMLNMIAADGVFEVHELMGLQLEYLKQFSVIVLQNYNVPLTGDAPFVKTLRAYAEQGGGVALVHDTAWFMASPFPEVATRGIPRHSVEAERHVVETPLKVAAAHPALTGLAVGTEFPTEFRDHMIFKPGPQGVVPITNTFGDPVYVLGQVGKGRVAFIGPYECYKQDLSGAERQAFLGVTRWLGGK